MKTSPLISSLLGVALFGGAALAQAERPREEEPGFRPDAERRERMEQRERMERRLRQEQPQERRFEGERGPHAPFERFEGERPMMPRGGFEGERPMMRPRGEGRFGEPRGGFEGKRPMMQPRGGRGPGEAGEMAFFKPERLKAAGATDQQLAALKALADEQAVKRIDLEASVEKAELALNQIIRADKPDVDAALKAVDALSKARAELTKLELGTRLKAREVLGEEVHKKLRELAAEGPGRPGVPGPRRGERDAPPPGERPPAHE